MDSALVENIMRLVAVAIQGFSAYVAFRAYHDNKKKTRKHRKPRNKRK